MDFVHIGKGQHSILHPVANTSYLSYAEFI